MGKIKVRKAIWMLGSNLCFYFSPLVGDSSLFPAFYYWMAPLCVCRELVAWQWRTMIILTTYYKSQSSAWRRMKSQHWPSSQLEPGSFNYALSLLQPQPGLFSGYNDASCDSILGKWKSSYKWILYFFPPEILNTYPCCKRWQVFCRPKGMVGSRVH